MSTHNAIQSVNPNFIVRSEERDRDTTRFEIGSSSEVAFQVTYFESEPNLLDIERQFSLSDCDERIELCLRRELDLVTQDYPFVRVHIETYHRGALVRLALQAELPIRKDERASAAEKYVNAFMAAGRDVDSQLLAVSLT